jgi:hypothetical protein
MTELLNARDVPNVPDFEQMKVSTKTIIAVTNMKFNLTSLYRYLPITEYYVVKKKRGRKSNKEVINPNKYVPVGSIISVQNKTNVRGVILKAKRKESKTYFLNSVTVVMVLEGGKLVNLKISHNGKLQMTGCKNDGQFITSLQYMYQHMKNAERWSGQKMFSLKDTHTGNPKIIFKVVMKNIDFNLGFPVQRDNLDWFFKKRREVAEPTADNSGELIQSNDFISLFESPVNTGVNIKIKSSQPFDLELTCVELLENGQTKISSVPHTMYYSYTDEIEKKREPKKIKFITFLIFSSGSVIMSGAGPLMKPIYYKFMEILLSNRKEYEEVVET